MFVWLQICDFGSSFSCALAWHKAQVAESEQVAETPRAEKHEAVHRHHAGHAVQVS